MIRTRRAKTLKPGDPTNLIRVRDQDRGEPANLRCKIDADTPEMAEAHVVASIRDWFAERSGWSLIPPLQYSGSRSNEARSVLIIVDEVPSLGFCDACFPREEPDKKILLSLPIPAVAPFLIADVG
ncbi:hypothetical protein [Mesorhizobium neociceri]|uniref:Uncharacterized protein n=1 Tax=Mesorhizobium neociceri TaxID=1307853 RepID=A0A838BEV8_9HYPH|nr:hypothetical protein [Mesorhizobium neociceri]MBA1144763.1 hypothetical protein [Mesorhizobium neociceri]